MSTNAHLSKPIHIGGISSHSDRRIVDNRENLRYLAPINENNRIYIDLNPGFSSYIRKEAKDYMNDLLPMQKWAIRQKGTDPKQVFDDADIVTSRGALKTIALTRYNYGEGWRMIAYRVGNVVYLHDFAVADGKKFANRPSDQNLPSYWGFKFEHLMTINKCEEEKESDDDIIDCRETYHSVVRSNIISKTGSTIKLAYSAEIDAIDDDDKYIELKTMAMRKLPNNFYLRYSYQWWIQSYLVGIDRVVLGFRNDNGIVSKIKTVPCTYLRSYNGEKCDIIMNYLSDVLTKVVDMMKTTNSVQIRFNPFTNKIEYEKPCESEINFIASEYKERFNLQ